MDRYAEFVFSEAFRAARVALKMTQKDLATAMGVDVSQVGTWENCRSFPPIEYWGAIKDTLGIDVVSHDKARSGIGLTDFCNVVYKLRIAKGMTRGEFQRNILRDRRPNVSLWESGEGIPTVILIERMEEALKDVPGIESLRPAWEKEVDKLDEAMRPYYRGVNRYKNPRKKKTPVPKEKSYRILIRNFVKYDTTISATSRKAAKAEALRLLNEGSLVAVSVNTLCRVRKKVSE